MSRPNPDLSQERLQAHMRKLGWEFYQTGPEEGQWMLANGDKFIAHQGDKLWNRHVKIFGQQEQK